MGDNRSADTQGPTTTDTFHKLLELFEKKKLLDGDLSNEKVVDFQHPTSLKKLLNLSIDENGCSEQELLEVCEQCIDYSVKTSHPHFFNQLFNRVDPYGVMGSLMTDLLNTNEHTFEAAPVFILATKQLLFEFQKLLGYKQADIMMFPGGSLANFNAVHLARHRLMAECNDKGMYGSKRLTMFASEECHYSIKKAALFMGFGLDSVRAVKTDDKGRMCTQHLAEQINESKEKGEIPFFVMATSGTTVIGAFDPLNTIADICDKNKLWLHVDGCWGGAVLFSETHKHLMEGVHRSNSFCTSLHKMMGAPIQCVPFIVNDKDILADSLSFDVPYLFQTDKFYDTSYDMGTKTMQCGRRPDALKFWLMWKARGHRGLQQILDKAMENAKLLANKIKNRPGFRLVQSEYEYLNISYWYIPPSMRGLEENDTWKEQLNAVAPKIKERMTIEGSMMIGYQSQKEKDRVNFFRIIIQNPNLTEKDLDFVIEETERFGCDL